MADLRRFDLNLLTAFEALMRARSVTGAASALGIGQPATSAALKRLRILLDDPLFVRGPGGLAPTSRALALDAVVSRALAEVRTAMFRSDAFDPTTANRVFRIAITDSVAVAVLSPLLEDLAAHAPGVQVVLTPFGKDDIAASLGAGRVDLVVGHLGDADARDRSGALMAERLYTDEFVCLFDPTACGVGGPISVDDFARLPHILMTVRGDLTGVGDRALRDLGLGRRVLLAAPYFLVVPFLLHGLAAVACVPRRLAERCANVTRLAVSAPPVPMPAIDIALVWAARSDADPGLVWLRRRLHAAVQDPGRGTPDPGSEEGR